MWLLNFDMPNRSEKTFDPIRRRECHGRTDRQTDTQKINHSKDQSTEKRVQKVYT